ncbi:MAG: hypothetical protein GY822_07795 [Deltaproteobacteria bacterium]|nr:hypothetical protein [Deltaproteobacteria bacterium]
MPLAKPQMATLPAEFLARARREAERYGVDPFLFLREWVQNSRDAGALTLHFRWQVLEEGRIRLSCEDDGCGMTTLDAEGVLLRLYATSKDDEFGSERPSKKGKAATHLGRFGVGFWSLLLCAPDEVGVDTLAKNGGVALLLDVNAGTLAKDEPQRSSPGTKVWVEFQPWGNIAELRTQAILRLKKDAGNVRSMQDGQSLDVFFDDELCNQTLAEHAKDAEPYRLSSIREKRFDGIIGLGRNPMVRLYCGGLLVREESSLEALLPRHVHQPQNLCGLFPVVLVNADELNVLLNRREISEDALLLEIIRKAERRLKKEQLHLVEDIAPMALHFKMRLLFSLSSSVSRKKILGALGVLAVILAFGIGIELRTRSVDSNVESSLSAATPQGAPRSIANAVPPEKGPVVDALGTQNTRWAFSYTGGGAPLFRSDTLSKRSEEQGLAPEVLSKMPMKGGHFRRYPSLDDVLNRKSRIEEAAASVRIALGLPKGLVDTAMPVPLEHVLDLASVEIFPEIPVEIWLRKDGVAVIHATLTESSSLQYRTVPGRLSLPAPKIEKDSSRRQQQRRIRQWPKGVRKKMKKWRRLRSAGRKAKKVQLWVQNRLRYTVDPKDAQRSRKTTGSFVTRVLALGFGDCDVMNTLAARLLMDVGVPAQVGIGFVGRDGTLAPQLHAWTEYWDGRDWAVFDVSQSREPGELSALSSIGPNDRQPETNILPASTDEVRAHALHSHQEESLAGSVERHIAEGSSAPLLENLPPFRSTALIVLGFLAMLFAFLWRVRSRRQSESVAFEHSGAMAQMLEFLTQHPDAEDRMQLRKRPIFPTLAGNKLSLDSASLLGDVGQLIGAQRECLSAVQKNVLELDATEFKQMDNLIPQILMLRSEVVSPLVHEVKALLEKACMEEELDVTFHFSQSAPLLLQEATWPSSNSRAVLQIGTKHPDWSKNLVTDGNAGIFLLVQQILSESELLSAWRAPLLSNVARMLLRDNT